jgi:hypothetical protein
MVKNGGLFDLFPNEPAGSVAFCLRLLLTDKIQQIGMMPIETIQQKNFVTEIPQSGGDAEQAQRFCPEIISGKIEYPRIDDQDFFR